MRRSAVGWPKLAYRVVAAATVRRRLAGDDLVDVATVHWQRLNRAFDTIEYGLSVEPPS